MEPVKAPAPLVIISSSPYIHCGSTISAAMRDVLLSLLPALAAAVYFFGWPALSVILTCRPNYHWVWLPSAASVLSLSVSRSLAAWAAISLTLPT